MIAAVDVQYGDRLAAAACVVFDAWEAARPVSEHVTLIHDVQPYVPGAFFERELPCVRAVLAAVSDPLETVVIDGYVWLDAAGRKGLGAHLYESLEARVPIIGVAKTAFDGSAHACSVLRGESARPLYVTAVGLPLELAAERVQSMHGSFRSPTLLKRVDQSCREALAAAVAGA